MIPGSNEEVLERSKKRFEEINKVSESFCLAKWKQSTIHLQMGRTHSCHHPVPHRVPLEELKESPSALHNTKFKTEQREKMRSGERPPECDYCWKIEDLGPKHLSDRMYKSVDETWAYPFLDEVIKTKDSEIQPSYLEVSFENTCNFKCAYCSPEISSKWYEEIKKGGGYKLSGRDNIHEMSYYSEGDRILYDKDAPNPYVDAFWKWWPELYENLVVFRITGGEPLLSKNTWQVFEEIKRKPNPKLELAINTNLGVPTAMVDKLITNINEIQGKVKSVSLFTSLESTGKAAEYARYGLNYEKFDFHVNKILKETDCRLNFMVTANILSGSTFDDFLTYIYKLRNTYNECDSDNRVPIMIAYLRWPAFLDIRILPDELKKVYAKNYIRFSNDHTKYKKPGGKGRIYLEEVDQINRLIDYMFSEVDDLEKRRADFATYIEQYDQRRSTDFNSTFPDLAGYIEGWKEKKSPLKALSKLFGK